MALDKSQPIAYLPFSLRLLWDDRPALALDAESVRKLVDYCGPRILESLKQLHDYGVLEHGKAKKRRAQDAILQDLL
jgi:hypothetical protein